MLKNSKKIIFVISICALFIIFGGEKISYITFYMLTGGILFSYVVGRIGFKNIRTFQTMDEKDYYTNDYITITSHLKNQSIFPAPYVEVSDKTGEKMSADLSKPYINFLMPYQSITISDDFKVKYRGIYEAGPLEVKYGDIFGFFDWSKFINSNKHIYIYPKYYLIQRLKLNSIMTYGVMSTKIKSYEDNNDVSDIKKYSYGDSVKKIHWKISAKKGHLFVKNFELSASASAYIFLDFNKSCFEGTNSRDLEERSVETAATVIYFFLKKLVTVNFYINNSKGQYEKGRSIADFKNFLELFCKVRPDGDSEIIDIVKKRIKAINKGSSLVIITGFLDMKKSQEICLLKKLGYDVIVIYVNEFPLDSESYLLFNEQGIEYTKINKDSDIKGVLENI